MTPEEYADLKVGQTIYAPAFLAADDSIVIRTARVYGTPADPQGATLDYVLIAPPGGSMQRGVMPNWHVTRLDALRAGRTVYENDAAALRARAAAHDMYAARLYTEEFREEQSNAETDHASR